MTAPRAVLVVLGGLPGTGKSAVAKAYVRATGASYLRIDTIEQTLVSRTSAEQPVGPIGYEIGYALAVEQLRTGTHTLVADCVNPLALTRDAWVEVAAVTAAALVEVEVVCSDPTEHRRRVETRDSDVPDLRLPTWQEVQDRDYQPWDRDRLILDTAQLDPGQCAHLLARATAHAR